MAIERTTNCDESCSSQFGISLSPPEGCRIVRVESCLTCSCRSVSSKLHGRPISDIPDNLALHAEPNGSDAVYVEIGGHRLFPLAGRGEVLPLQNGDHRPKMKSVVRCAAQVLIDHGLDGLNVEQARFL